MSAIFTVNFRREAYQRDVARARRRVLVIATWVTYFGVLVVVLGLYGLNCAALTHRVDQLERQAVRLRALQGSADESHLRPEQITQLEQYVANPGAWHDRLARLPQVLPPGARIVTLALNPQSATGSAAENALVLTGVLRPPSGQDRMRGVTSLVETLRADTSFARGYGSIRLVSTRMAENDENLVEFTIECR